MADADSNPPAADSQTPGPPAPGPDAPGPDAPAGETRPVDELLAERRRKLQRLREEFGLDPFGQRLDGLIPLADARARFDEAADLAQKENAQDDRRPRVRVAGRIVQHRVLGNLIFMLLRDATGDLQVAVSKKQVAPDAFKLAKLAELSDIVAAEGPLGTTKTGEVTLWAERQATAEGQSDTSHIEHPTSPIESGFTLVTKSLALPPGKWHGLQDPELRYRKRYVDLYANPEAMRTMQLRIRIVEAIRTYLRQRGYLEVETPMLQPIHGGAAARPFVTHHNALDMRLYLRIAPELYLKRLLVGGMPKVFEINRNFRNEGISPQHNPEFTMLEAYEAFGSWETMAELVEDMVCTVAQEVFGTLVIRHGNAEGAEEAEGAEGTGGTGGAGGRTINLTRPWRRVSMVDLVAERTGWKFDKRPLQEAEPELFEAMISNQVEFVRDELLRQRMAEDFDEAAREQFLKGLRGDPDRKTALEKAVEKLAGQQNELELSPRERAQQRLSAFTPAEQLVEVYEKLIEPTLIDPTFVTHVPSVIIPLAKENRDDPFFADVYELAINGTEISPGYTELNDPDVQERHFRHQVGDPRNHDEQQPMDEDFLDALRVGMPPAGGMGLGIDRLVMMLTGATSIRDVILFPLMRPRGESG